MEIPKNAHSAALREALAPLDMSEGAFNANMVVPQGAKLRPGPQVVTFGHSIAHAILTHYREKTVSLPMLLALIPDAAAAQAAFAASVPTLSPAVTTMLFARAVREASLDDQVTLEERLRTAATTFNLDATQIDALVTVSTDFARTLRERADKQTISRFLSGPSDSQDIAGALSNPLRIEWGLFRQAYEALQAYISTFRNRVDPTALRDPFISLESSDAFNALLAMTVALEGYPLARWHYNLYQLLTAQEEISGRANAYSFPRVTPLFASQDAETVLQGVNVPELAAYRRLFGDESTRDLEVNPDVGQFKYYTVDVPEELKGVYLEDLIASVVEHDSALFPIRQGAIDVLDGLSWALKRANTVVYPEYPIGGRSLWDAPWVQTLLAARLLEVVANPSGHTTTLLATLKQEASAYLGSKIENQAAAHTINTYLTLTLGIIEAFHSVRNMFMDAIQNFQAHDLRTRYAAEQPEATMGLPEFEMHHPELVAGWLRYYQAALDELARVDEAPTSASAIFSVQRVRQPHSALSLKDPLTFAVVVEPYYTNAGPGRVSLKDVPVERAADGSALVRLASSRRSRGMVIPRAVRDTMAQIRTGSLGMQAIPITVESPALPYEELGNLIRLIPNPVAQTLARYGTAYNVATGGIHPAWVAATLLERTSLTTVNTLGLEALRASILGLGTGVWVDLGSDEEGAISRVIRQRAVPSLARMVEPQRNSLPSGVVTHANSSIFHDTGSSNLVFIWPTRDYDVLREQAPQLIDPMSLPYPVFGIQAMPALHTLPVELIITRGTPEKVTLDRLTFQQVGTTVRLLQNDVKPENEFDDLDASGIPVYQPMETAKTSEATVAMTDEPESE